MFEGQTCLITGGTGSWGQALTRQLMAENPQEIRIFSRNEFTQVQMQRTLSNANNVRFIIGDVRDRQAVDGACRGVDYVFHLAALKHVPVCEHQPAEAMKTNIVGTQHVIRASIEHGVKKVIDVSTDKAVNPVNFYGMTKAMGEKLILHANQLSPHTRFVCIRGGNVLGTNGSVVPYFKEQIRTRQEVTLTHRDMTRFFLTISDAIRLLLKAAKVTVGGETFVMKMKTCRIADLAAVLANRLTSQPIQMREIGIRPGEKLHEVLVSQEESPHTYCYEDEYFVILPADAPKTLVDHYHALQKVDFQSYDSSSDWMSYAEIEEMLVRGGFLP